MSLQKVYSPTQAALGGLLGGALASTYFIQQNFKTVNDTELVKKTNRYGTLVIVLILMMLPFIPENFPNMIIPFIIGFSTKTVIEKFQFKKEDIINNDDLDFHSNWRVFFISFISMIIFTVVAISFLLIIDTLGIVSLTE